MRTIRLVPIVLVLCIVLVAAPRARAAATPVDELLSLINADRALVGAAPLALRSDLTDIAGAWSVSMADAGVLAHNDAYFSADVRRRIGPGARGENVAYAGDIASVHHVLMTSPPHRTNLLNPAYTVVGIGAVFDGRLWWVTQDFLAAPAPAPLPAAPPPAASPLPAPPTEPLVTTSTVPVVRAVPEAEAPPMSVSLAPAPPAPAVVAAAPAAQVPLSIDLELQGAPDPDVAPAAPPTSTVSRAAGPAAPPPAARGVPAAGLVALLALGAAASGAVRASRGGRA